MAITVEKRDRWVVLDDGYVYDMFDDETLARAAAHRLIEDEAIGAVIDARIDELAAELWDRARPESVLHSP